MQFIALQNFKSYEKQVVNNLNSQINLIIGKNGQGKSNFFKAISFALTNRVTLNKTEYISHKHRAIDTENRPIRVELYVKSKVNQQKYDQNIQHLQRIWQNDSNQELRVNDKPFTAHQYQSFVQSLGFSYSNPYNIIQQGKITQITLMDQFQIYKLLEQATGLKKYQKRLLEALEYMKKNEEQKSEISNIMKQIESRLNSYQQKRQEYEYYSFQQKAAKVKNKVQFQILINKFDSQIKSLKQKEARSYDQLTKVKLSMKDKQSELVELNDKISVNQKQMYSFANSTMEDDQLNVSVNLSQENKETAAKLKKISATKEKFKKQLQKVTSEVQKIKQQMKPYKEKYDYLTLQLQAMKSSKLGLSKGKQELKGQIKKYEENVKQIESELKKVNKMKSQFKIPPTNIQLNEIVSKKQKLSQVQNQLRANKIKYFESSRLKNQYESESAIIKQHIEVNYSKMRKLLPGLDFNLLNELRKQKIQGVYGFLVQFLAIETDFLFAYEISGLNKLCTLLVENEQVCNVVVNLNKKIKGRQINILPMSFVKKMANPKRAVPEIDDCFSLLNQQWIKVRPHNHGDQFTKLIQKILGNTFGGHLLVKDYDIGLKVSKEFHLNCITADKQIVYSEGYLCKVGKDANVDDRLQTYLKYQQKNLEQQRIAKKLAEANKEVMELQNVELDLMKKKVQLQSQIRNAQLHVEVVNDQKRSLNRLQEQIKKLQERKNRYEQDIKKKTQILNSYDKKGQITVNMNEFKQTEELYNSKLKLYNQKSEEQCSLENKLLEVLKEEEHISQQIKNINNQLSFQKEFNLSFVASKQYQQNLQQTNQNLEKEKQALQAEILRLGEIYAERQTQNYNFLGQIALLEDEIRYYASKIEEMGNLDITMQEIQEKSNSFSLSISRMDQKKKMRLYSAGQKLMFAKIDTYIAKYKDSVKKLKQLEEHQRHLNDMIFSFETQKEKSISTIFNNFERYFDSIFKTITLHGKTDIRLKKINDRSRGITKTKNSIAIMVSFAGETTKTWNEFSGGQKTVIAICLLMALQKCQPAPFYVLDQIDSALDQIYLERIVKLIEAQSERSQYFITTFKQQMLALKEQKCNYYLVQNTNRVSTIERISLAQAKEVMQDLVVR